MPSSEFSILAPLLKLSHLFAVNHRMSTQLKPFHSYTNEIKMELFEEKLNKKARKIVVNYN